MKNRNISFVEYPKKYLLKSSYPKKILAKIFLPKKIPKSKISNPKKSFDHLCHLKSEGHPGDTSRPCLHVNLQMTNDGSVITSVVDVLLILVNAVFFFLRTSYTFRWRSPMAMLVSY